MQNPNGVIDFDIETTCPVYQSFRASKVRSMFNVEEANGSTHKIKTSLPLGEKGWSIGAIIGPSGSGKTTLGKELFGGGKIHHGFDWDSKKPIIDQILPEGDFKKATAALTSVGLGTVPSWLRPYHVLSMGEKFRAEMARVVSEKPHEIVIDEFTSVVDRQVAQVGSAAFAKAWRKGGGKAVVLACHYDIIEWLQPDWVLDTRHWKFEWRCLRRRPEISFDVHETSSPRAWNFFKPHHYLDIPNPIAATYYIAEIGETPIAHVAVATQAGLKTARITRLVVMPEWQGAGVGMKFLEYVAQRWLSGENRYSKKMTGVIHTSHPGLIFALNRSNRWVLVSQQIGGGHKGKSAKTAARAAEKRGGGAGAGAGYGGHLRATAGFRYVGDRAA